jgi:hypothetical protein
VKELKFVADCEEFEEALWKAFGEGEGEGEGGKKHLKVLKGLKNTLDFNSELVLVTLFIITLLKLKEEGNSKTLVAVTVEKGKRLLFLFDFFLLLFPASCLPLFVSFRPSLHLPNQSNLLKKKTNTIFFFTKKADKWLKKFTNLGFEEWKALWKKQNLRMENYALDVAELLN